MKSVVNIVFGNPMQLPYGGLTVPMMLTISDDDSEGDAVPYLQNMVISLAFDDETLSKDVSEICSYAVKSLDVRRFDFGPIGFARLRDGILDFISKAKLDKLARPVFPEPASETRH